MAAQPKYLQVGVFLLVWLLYALSYLVRKPLGVLKLGMSAEMLLSSAQMGFLDTALLLPYAAAQALLGCWADKMGPRATVTLCLAMAGLAGAAMSMTGNYVGLVVLVAMTGAAQGPVWPACCKILGAWFPDNRLGVVFGVAATSAYGGSVIATAVASWLLEMRGGWRMAVVPLGLTVSSVAVPAWLLLRMPQDLGVTIPGKEPPPPSAGDSSHLQLRQLWCLPAVPQIAFAMFTVKMVRYAIYLWLPVYLMSNLGQSAAVAGVLLALFDVGGVAGSAGLGLLADRSGSLYYLWISLAGGSLALLSFMVSASWGPACGGIILMVLGACVCGPDALLGSSVPVAIGERGGRGAGATVAGLVNGFGTLGGVVEGPLVGVISETFGWTVMFMLLSGLLGLGALCILRATVIETRQMRSVHLPT